MSNNDLIKYLNQSQNSKLRESIFKYAFFHNIKVAAASQQMLLKIYEPEIDDEGDDVIIADTFNNSIHLQLKSKFHSLTKVWPIHKRILLPPQQYMEAYGVYNTICPVNPSGIVLIEGQSQVELINSSTSISYKYYYTDINIILLIKLGIISTSPKTIRTATNIFSHITDESNFSRIVVPKSLFIGIPHLTNLLKLIGFSSDSIWRKNCIELIRNKLSKSQYLITQKNYDPYNTNSEMHSHMNDSYMRETLQLEKLIKLEFERIIRP